jgi:hypothetical protein
MSDTPKTDEQSQLDAAKYQGHSQDYVSLLNFTRELERELNELKTQLMKDKSERDKSI